MGSLNQKITILILFSESGSYFMGKFHLIRDRNPGWIFTGGDGGRGEGLKRGWMVWTQSHMFLVQGKQQKFPIPVLLPLMVIPFISHVAPSSSPPWQGPVEPRRMWKLTCAPPLPCHPKLSVCLNWSSHPIHWCFGKAVGSSESFYSFSILFWLPIPCLNTSTCMRLTTFLKRVYFSFWKQIYFSHVQNVHMFFFCPPILFPKAVTQCENPLLLEINSILLI